MGINVMFHKFYVVEYVVNKWPILSESAVSESDWLQFWVALKKKLRSHLKQDNKAEYRDVNVNILM